MSEELVTVTTERKLHIKGPWKGKLEGFRDSPSKATNKANIKPVFL